MVRCRQVVGGKVCADIRQCREGFRWHVSTRQHQALTALTHAPDPPVTHDASGLGEGKDEQRHQPQHQASALPVDKGGLTGAQPLAGAVELGRHLLW